MFRWTVDGEPLKAFNCSACSKRSIFGRYLTPVSIPRALRPVPYTLFFPLASKTSNFLTFFIGAPLFSPIVSYFVMKGRLFQYVVFILLTFKFIVVLRANQSKNTSCLLTLTNRQSDFTIVRATFRQFATVAWLKRRGV